MKSLLQRPRPTDRRLQAEQLLFAYSAYFIPVALLVISAFAVLFWTPTYLMHPGIPVQFTVLEDVPGALSQEDARPALRALAPVSDFETHLSENPIWLMVPAREGRTRDAGLDGSTVLEFPSRHATQISCWTGDDAHAVPAGSADRWTVPVGLMVRAKAGFALDLGILPTDVVCRAHFSGPARLTVNEWGRADFDLSTDAYHRDSGLVDGGLALLALFVLLVAWINKEWLYVVFAAWLFGNMRMAAISAGWDFQWFGHSIPWDYMIASRKFTTMSYYVLTVTLFSLLLRDSLQRAGWRWLLVANQWACAPLVLAALSLPYARYLPVLWVLGGFTIGSIIFFLARILVRERSRVAMWYSISLAISMMATVYEVVAAAFGFRGLLGMVNSVTAALASSLMAALAIAEQMRNERIERRRVEAELKATYDAIPIGLFTLADDGRLLRANPVTYAIFEEAGLRHDGQWPDLFEPGMWERLLEAVSAAPMESEIVGRHTVDDDGLQRLYFVRVVRVDDRIEGSIQDVTERAHAVERLRFLADHDPLTGVLNRRGLEAAFDEQPAGDPAPSCMAYLDLDRFKLINDLFGHAAGDEVLRQICTRVRECLGPQHVFARVGGDEFVVLFQNLTLAGAGTVCETIIQEIADAPYLIGEKAFRVNVSIGLVELASGATFGDAVSTADRACRDAKRHQAGHLVVFHKDAAAFKERQEEIRLLGLFGHDTPPEGLFLVMQPIMSLRNPHETLNFEVLVRMHGPGDTLTSAWPIISTAENHGRIATVDRWVLGNTLDWIEQHHARLDRTKFVCVNLSGGSLNDEHFVRDAYAMLDAHPNATKLLCLEITESVALHDLSNTVRFVDQVMARGARVALDDFGAGYTSFSHLRQLPADVLKIDGAFVKAARSHPGNLSIIGAIAELASNLGMRTIAEWAEDLETIKAMEEIGIDYLQGFAIARPQLPEAILGAKSAASFIEDASVAEYVTTNLGGKSLDLWEAGERHQRHGLH